MPPSQVVQFAQFVITGQVFYATTLSAALVNLKPILPGHSLVIPRRVVPRYADLSVAEV
jgi:bis(5'-adenosyl)-triphosphatase